MNTGSFFWQKLDRVLAFAVIPLILVAVNVWLIWPIFTGELSTFTASIEVGYIQAGKFLAEFPRHTWNPLWYSGFPFHVMYNPVLPYVERFLAAAAGVPIGQAYRILTGLAVVLTPALLSLFVRKLVGRTSLGLVSGLSWSLLPSFSAVFPLIAQNIQRLHWAPWHLIVLMEYGEGTHTLGLLFVPLFGWLALRAFAQPSFSRALLAAAALAAAALTSMIALLASLILFGVIAASEGFLAAKQRHRPGRTSAAIFVVFLGLIAFWFNPQFLKTSFGFGTGTSILGTYGRFALFIPFVLGIVFAALYWIFRGRERRQGLLVAGLWFLLLFAIVFAWQQFGVALAPQPIRYLPEASLAVILFGAVLIGLGLSAIPRPTISHAVEATLVAGLVAAIVAGSGAYRRTAHALVAPRTDPVEASREFRLAERIAALPNAERVYATGNDAFYLNLFTKVHQLRGALDQAAINSWWAHASYQIATGADLAPTDALVRAMNLNYVVVTTGSSANPYHDFKNPDKFAAWELISDDAGDLIFRAPLVQPALAQLVSGTQFAGLREPENAVDLPRLQAYADWIDRDARPVKSLVWDNNGRLRIRATPTAGDLVSVQVTYDRGWRARSGDDRLEVKRDVLDNLVIVPARAGEQEIVLEYRKPASVWFGYAITLLTLLGLGLYPKVIRPHLERGRRRLAEEDRRRAEAHRQELRQLGLDGGSRRRAGR